MEEKFSVLYVDDEEHNLVSFKAAFRRDYNIFTANSAKEGIDLLRHNDIGLIITDQRMPEMTGVQFLEKVVHEFPNAVRMILTGFSDLDAIIEAINSGRVYRYITKPWDQNELKVAIENAKQLYQLQLKNKKLIGELKSKVTEQERILKLFEEYVPTSIVEKVLENGEETIFEGEIAQCYYFVLRFAWFYCFMRKVKTRETVNFLNTYYSLMTKCFKKHDGFVTQFVEMKFLPFFCAPVDGI
jgi:response regulator RpfG family c-di-GMP phosphodiesterase